MSNRVTSAIGSRRARENLVRLLFHQSKKDQIDDAHAPGAIDHRRRQHSYSQLRAAYIELVHTIHPDKFAFYNDDEEERIRKEECQEKFVELQSAWEEYHASVREVRRDRHRNIDRRSRMSGDNSDEKKDDDDRATFDDDSFYDDIEDANFTMFGVGCSFADTPDERDRRDKIMEQASRGWFPSASLSFRDNTGEGQRDYSNNEFKVESCREDDDTMHSCLDTYAPRVPLIDNNMFVSEEEQSNMNKEVVSSRKVSLIQNVDKFRSRKQ
jgi:hypothetical protein